MAAKKTTSKSAPKKEEKSFVSADEFQSFQTQMTDTLSAMMEVMKSNQQAPVSSQAIAAVEAEVKKADPDAVPVNPEWERTASEIIGDAVHHCEMKHMKNGGILFTVVIKNEKSNAPKDYLARYGQDRRTKEIGSGGFGDVEVWCKLIAQNLARPSANNSGR